MTVFGRQVTDTGKYNTLHMSTWLYRLIKNLFGCQLFRQKAKTHQNRTKINKIIVQEGNEIVKILKSSFFQLLAFLLLSADDFAVAGASDVAATAAVAGVSALASNTGVAGVPEDDHIPAVAASLLLLLPVTFRTCLLPLLTLSLPIFLLPVASSESLMLFVSLL